MDFIYNPLCLNHDTGEHPENKSRLLSLGDLPMTDITPDPDLPLLVHDKNYVEMVRQACRESLPLDVDTRTSPGSMAAALCATTATVLVAERNGFALVRPPGHHAYRDRGTGFCLFNHIAIATQSLVNQGKRVLIVDFDGHLGDGTSDIFYDTDNVLFWSLHQYPAFPGNGLPNEIGTGKGKGFTFNVPLPPDTGDDLFMEAFETVLQIAKQFEPDVVAVSAGFDAHQYDPLLQLRLTAPTYYQIGRLLAEYFPALFATLEGGYNTDVLPSCVFNFIDGINGAPMRFHEEQTSSTEIVRKELLSNLGTLMNNLMPYWTIQ